MAHKERFSWPQKIEHAKRTGWQCEWELEKGVRCPTITNLEADHAQPKSANGLTEEENMIICCRVHHIIKHLLDGEGRAAYLIFGRLNDDEKKELERLRNDINI